MDVLYQTGIREIGKGAWETWGKWGSKDLAMRLRVIIGVEKTQQTR